VFHGLFSQPASPAKVATHPTFLIADKITITGNSTLGDNYTLLTNGSPVQSSTLYE
jgi:acetyltransferase-like isoleucine patch superfamily enzyme